MMKKSRISMFVLTCVIGCALCLPGCGDSGDVDKASEDSIASIEQVDISLDKAIHEYLQDSSEENLNRAIKVVNKEDKESTWNYMREEILKYTDDKDDATIDRLIEVIEDCQELYVASYEETHPKLMENMNLSTSLFMATNEKRKLVSSYPYDFATAVQEYQYADIYVAYRMENSYSDTLLGAIDKEINQYIPKEYSQWVIYNVEYNEFWGPVRGDEEYVLYSQNLNPFNKEGVYSIPYYNDGTTIPVARSGGFKDELPLIYMIDEFSIQSDYEAYVGYEEDTTDIINKIRELSGEEALIENVPEENYSDHSEQKEEYANVVGMVTIDDIINTQWTQSPYEEYSFSITGNGNDLKLRIFDTNNPDNVHFEGYARTVTSTELADLYMSFGFGKADEIAVIWQGVESIDYPLVEAISDTWEEYAGDYHYLKMLEDNSTDGEYIFPNSSTEYLTDEDVKYLDSETLRLGRNEIYAKHGRSFQTEDLNLYFNSKSWYYGYLSAEEFDDSVLNVYEKVNLELIKYYESLNAAD